MARKTIKGRNRFTRVSQKIYAPDLRKAFGGGK